MYKALCLVITVLFTLSINGIADFDEVLVTAVQTESGHLKIITWYLDESGNLVRANEASAGAISGLATFYKDSYKELFTAVRDGSGDLKIIRWKMGGEVTRMHDASAGRIGLVSICPVAVGKSGKFLLATAVQDADGKLNVSIWDYQFRDRSIARRSSASAGRISLLSACPIRSSIAGQVDGLATAVQDADGNLKVIVWHVDNDGNVVRKGSASAGPISLVSVIPVSFGVFGDKGVLATAVRDGSGNLKVIIWDVDGEGNVVRKDSASAEPVGLISAAMLYTEFGFADRGRFVTAVQDSNGNLKVIGWNVDDRSLQVTRLGSATAGAVSLISCCPIPYQGMGIKDGFVTAVRTGSGNIKNIFWAMDIYGNLERIGEGSAGSIGLVSANGMWGPNVYPY